jgi:hypothetical protein
MHEFRLRLAPLDCMSRLLSVVLLLSFNYHADLFWAACCGTRFERAILFCMVPDIFHLLPARGLRIHIAPPVPSCARRHRSLCKLLGS